MLCSIIGGGAIQVSFVLLLRMTTSNKLIETWVGVLYIETNACAIRADAADGTPRNCLFVTEQLEDYRSVVKWVKSGRHKLDPQRIILWGTSFSGLSSSTPSNLRSSY